MSRPSVRPSLLTTASLHRKQMRALLALLMRCAPTKKTAPDSDASTDPAEGAEKGAKPAKRGAGTVPQAVEQATAIDEGVQRIAKEEAAKAQRIAKEEAEKALSLAAKEQRIAKEAAEKAQRIAKEAAAAVGPLKLSNEDGHWRKMGGAELESALQVDPEHGDSPVALIDARYIVELWKRGGKILRRQDLPKEAFIDLETLKRLPKGNITNDLSLRVIAVSHPWQQPDHPDPKEVNLTRLAKVLEGFLPQTGPLVTSQGYYKTIDRGEDFRNTYAVFFDFMSCFQKGPDGKRTDKETTLFNKALSNMMVWYAHPKTMIIKLTSLPEGYPNGFKFPEGVEPNMADYWNRGWCFCESSVSNLVKSSDFVLGGLTRISSRAPPLAPPVFKRNSRPRSSRAKRRTWRKWRTCTRRSLTRGLGRRQSWITNACGGGTRTWQSCAGRSRPASW